MPFLPDLAQGTQTRTVTDVFGGYNHNPMISEGEWYAEENLSSVYYPMFSQRPHRSVYASGRNLQGVLAKQALAWVDGSTLYYNGVPVSGLTLSTNAEDCPKQLVSMGAYLCIFPDCKYINTANLSDCGDMGADYQSVDGAKITYTLCRVDGSGYTGVTVQDAEPSSPQNGMYWVDTSEVTHVLKQYSATSSMWVEIPTVYTRINVANIGKLFEKYDGVTISGAKVTSGSAYVQAQIAALNNTSIIQDKGDDYIVVVGILDQMVEQTSGHIRVQRKIPKMDFVCESNNRLWGCFYGMSGGEMLNEIYACKLGDFKNWNCFMGISTDSYIVSVGTDGEFTGAISYNGYPLFFKENYMHKIYGNVPSGFQTQTKPCRGVQKGSSRSLQVVNEILYYKSRADICAYDGSTPTGISPQLGEVLYYEASAGSYRGRYYISMRDGENGWHMFTYDVHRHIWHREDSLHALGFATWGDSLFCLDAGTNKILDLNGALGEKEGAIQWSAESGLIGYAARMETGNKWAQVMVDQKYVSRFVFRMHLGEGSTCKMYLEYDSSGNWEEEGEIHGVGTDSFMIPVIPRRCDHFRIKLAGTGEVKIYSMAKFVEQGGDD